MDARTSSPRTLPRCCGVELAFVGVESGAGGASAWTFWETTACGGGGQPNARRRSPGIRIWRPGICSWLASTRTSAQGCWLSSETFRLLGGGAPVAHARQLDGRGVSLPPSVSVRRANRTLGVERAAGVPVPRGSSTSQDCSVPVRTTGSRRPAARRRLKDHRRADVPDCAAPTGEAVSPTNVDCDEFESDPGSSGAAWAGVISSSFQLRSN